MKATNKKAFKMKTSYTKSTSLRYYPATLTAGGVLQESDVTVLQVLF